MYTDSSIDRCTAPASEPQPARATYSPIQSNVQPQPEQRTESWSARQPLAIHPHQMVITDTHNMRE